MSVITVEFSDSTVVLDEFQAYWALGALNLDYRTYVKSRFHERGFIRIFTVRTSF